MRRIGRLRNITLLAIFLVAGCNRELGGTRHDAPPMFTPPPTPAAGKLGDGRLSELVEWARASQGVPALGAVVIHQGQVAERAVAGLRSVDNTVQVTVDDQWHLGAITESMTATLAAILVEDGLITWDTTVLDVWPELTTQIDPGFRTVTLRQLLSHTSGMKTDDDWPGSLDGATGTLMEKRRAWAARLLSEPPVAPLGMTHSGFGAPGTPGLLDEPLGHWDRNPRFEAVQPGPDADSPQAAGPAGTVHVTLNDFAVFLLAHLAGEQGKPGLLTTESFRTLHTPVAESYALGWQNSPVLLTIGREGWWHNGTNQRWFAITWFSPGADAGLLVVTNTGGDRGQQAMTTLDLRLRERIAASQ